MKKVISIVNLGCKVNYTDTEEISRLLKDKGYRVVYGDGPADLYIVNSCTVTNRADYESRRAARRAGESRNGSPVIVTGCAAKVYPERMENVWGVKAVIPPDKKDEIVNNVVSIIGPSGIDTRKGADSETNTTKRTRAFLKIQDGCNSFCTYCIVPYARGRERSISPREVIEKIEDLIGRGFREVVITGIHLGRYGADLNGGEIGLSGLLREIKGNFEGKSHIRIRLSSIEPLEVTSDLIDVMGESDFISPHLHIPLQSGDDNILKAMGRPYDSASFLEIIDMVHKKIPDPGFGMDVMVGFPGEGKKEFENTLDIISKIDCTYLHVFPFSPRLRTEAYRMGRNIDGKTKRERARILRELGYTKKEAYIEKNIGKELTVLTESFSNSMLSGKSENYLTVYFPGDKNEINSFKLVKIKKQFREGVYGERTV